MSDRWRADRIAEIRQAFNESFARPPEHEGGSFDDLLSIRIAGDPFALPLTEIARIHQQRLITPLPGSPLMLLGIAGIRGRLVAVYDLARVLGYEQANAPHRWLAICRAEDRWALSLGEVEGQLRVSRSRLQTVERGEGGDGHVHAVFEDGSIVRAVLNVPAILATLRRRLARGEATP
jgi:purine-binding chemotaxis protein CheW